METVHVHLPADLISAAGLAGPDVSTGAARLLALELFRQEKVSLGRAAELCETPLADFMDFAVSQGVPVFQYEVKDLEKDRRSLAELGL